MFLPLLITIMVSTATGSLFNRSLYENAIAAKNMPLLRNHLPKESRKTRVREVITGYELSVIESICSVGRLADVCRKDFNSIPVVNMAGKLIGTIPKNFIIVLLENFNFYEYEMMDGMFIKD